MATLFFADLSHAFYLPGVAPQDFAKVGDAFTCFYSPVVVNPACGSLLLLSLQGDSISLKVNKISSPKNLPFEYYSLPYCKPGKIISSAENLGEVLRGDRILNSLYQVCVCVCVCVFIFLFAFFLRFVSPYM